MHEVPLDRPFGRDFGLHVAKVGIPVGTGNSDTVSGRRLAWLVVQCSFNEYNKTFGACQKDGSVDMRVATECHRFKEGHLENLR